MGGRLIFNDRRVGDGWEEKTGAELLQAGFSSIEVTVQPAAWWYQDYRVGIAIATV